MGLRYFSFLPEEGCAFLKGYLEFRMNSLGEKVNPESPILTPMKSAYVGGHIRTISVGNTVRLAIRAAGFKWRPYVLRRYFATRMMMAESEGLIIRDWRQFWMGHRGDIEHTYTVNKSLPQDTIEMMRDAYARSADKFLVTTAAANSRDDVATKVRRQMLLTVGYSQEETEKLGLAEASEEQMQDLLKQKMLAVMMNNGQRQKIASAGGVERWMAEGWEWIGNLSDGRAILRLPAPSS